MSIELHCPGCSKLIRAPKDAGGRTGKCPYCERKVYIPMPSDEVEPIPLAPFDPDDERRDAEMREESARYAADVDHGGDATPKRGSKAAAPGVVVSVEDEVRKFVASMHASKLDEADAIAMKLAGSKQRAKDFIQGAMVDEMQMKVENVPPQLVQAFLKTLLARIDAGS